MKHIMIYRALKKFGFSPMKAGEIVLDARRGDKYAKYFIRFAFKDRHSSV